MPNCATAFENTPHFAPHMEEDAPHLRDSIKPEHYTQSRIVRTLPQQEKGSDYFCSWDSNHKNANVRRTFARRRLDDADTIMYRVPSGVPHN